MKYIRLTQIARWMNLSYDTLYAAVRRGELKCIQHKGYKGRKGAILVPVEEYDRWISECFSRA